MCIQLKHKETNTQQRTIKNIDKTPITPNSAVLGTDVLPLLESHGVGIGAYTIDNKATLKCRDDTRGGPRAAMAPLKFLKKKLIPLRF